LFLVQLGLWVGLPSCRPASVRGGGEGSPLPGSGCSRPGGHFVGPKTGLAWVQFKSGSNRGPPGAVARCLNPRRGKVMVNLHFVVSQSEKLDFLPWVFSKIGPRGPGAGKARSQSASGRGARWGPGACRVLGPPPSRPRGPQGSGKFTYTGAKRPRSEGCVNKKLGQCGPGAVPGRPGRGGPGRAGKRTENHRVGPSTCRPGFTSKAPAVRATQPWGPGRAHRGGLGTYALHGSKPNLGQTFVLATSDDAPRISRAS